MSDAKSIGNVNVLDLRKTREESIAGIRRIGNVNLVLYSEATLPLVSRLTLGNLNATVEVPAEADTRFVMGSYQVAAGSLPTGASASFPVVMGNVIIEGGADNDEVSGFIAGLSGMVVMGVVLCPVSLAALLQSKLKTVMGSVVTYPDDAVVINGPLDLSPQFLKELPRKTGFVVTGAVKAMDDAAGVLQEKLDYLQTRRPVVCHEANASTLRSKLRGIGAKLTVVPTGYRYHDGGLHLDAATVASLEGARLMASGSIIVEDDVDASAFGSAVAGLRSLAAIFCPKPLEAALKGKVDMVDDRVVFYEGDLWEFGGDDRLRRSRFEFSEGKATLLVTGDLRIDEDIEPKLLAERLAAVHNFGEIRCSPEQMGAIEARLGINDGELGDTTPEEEHEPTDIGNVNVLAL